MDEISEEKQENFEKETGEVHDPNLTFEMKDGDVVLIGDIKVHYLGLHNVFGQPRIGVTAPPNVTILREELTKNTRKKYDHVLTINFGDFLSIGEEVKLVTRDDPYGTGSVKVGIEAPRSMRIQRVNNRNKRNKPRKKTYRDDFSYTPLMKDDPIFRED